MTIPAPAPVRAILRPVPASPEEWAKLVDLVARLLAGEFRAPGTRVG